MDVKLQQYDSTGLIDIEIENDDFVLEEGLETMVLISLFSDGREETRREDPRGWWGASVQDEDRSAPPFGSKLWLLLREKQTDETRVKIGDWCQAALEWMVLQGIAEATETDVVYPRVGLVEIVIRILRGDRDPQDFKYQFLWDGQYGV